MSAILPRMVCLSANLGCRSETCRAIGLDFHLSSLKCLGIYAIQANLVHLS